MTPTEQLIAAALNLVDVKSRYHSEIAMTRLIETAREYRAHANETPKPLERLTWEEIKALKCHLHATHIYHGEAVVDEHSAEQWANAIMDAMIKKSTGASDE